MKNICPKCNGKKTYLDIGLLEKACDLCKNGYIEDEMEVMEEIKPSVPSVKPSFIAPVKKGKPGRKS